MKRWHRRHRTIRFFRVELLASIEVEREFVVGLEALSGSAGCAGLASEEVLPHPAPTARTTFKSVLHPPDDHGAMNPVMVQPNAVAAVGLTQIAFAAVGTSGLAGP